MWKYKREVGSVKTSKSDIVRNYCAYFRSLRGPLNVMITMHCSQDNIFT
jgi:hypothetical protein